MGIPTLRPTRGQFEKMVARYAQLTEVTTGLPDMEIDGYRRSFRLVLGGEQPKESGQHAPSGSQARPAIEDSTAPVNMGFVRAAAGNGVMMHNHDTSETFVVLEGRWRVSILGADGEEHIELGRHDVATIPPHVHRAFACLESGPGQDSGLLLAVVGNSTQAGTAAAVEFSPEALAAIAAHSAASAQPRPAR